MSLIKSVSLIAGIIAAIAVTMPYLTGKDDLLELLDSKASINETPLTRKTGITPVAKSAVTDLNQADIVLLDSNNAKVVSYLTGSNSAISIITG